ncbi:MAG: dethiobiotin synthase [Pirellulales bacterium]
MSPQAGLFITGTDTGVGKTYVTALLARSLAAGGYKVGVYKPVASGCQWVQGKLQSEDAAALWQAAGRPGELDRVCPQCFAAPLAPHLSARAEGKQVDASLLRTGLRYWRDRSEIVLVEGAGGLLSPISDDDFVADLAFEFGFPLIVVAANRLGTINATLQTLLATAHYGKGLCVAGVILNEAAPPSDSADPSRSSNLQELQHRCAVPVLAHVDWLATQLGNGVDGTTLAGWAGTGERRRRKDEG